MVVLVCGFRFAAKHGPATDRRVERESKSPRLRAGGFEPGCAQRFDFFFFLTAFFAAFFAAFLAAFLPTFLAEDFFAAFLDFFTAFFFTAFFAAFFFFAFLTTGFSAIGGSAGGGLIASGIGSLIGFSSSMSSPRVYRSDNDSGILGAVKAMMMLVQFARSFA